MERLIEQIASVNHQRYGRSSEKLDVIAGQMELEFIFNEAEALTWTLYVVEPAEEDVIQVTHQKKKGKREVDLKDLPVEMIPISFRRTSCRRSLAVTAGNSFRTKSTKESGFSRQSIRLKNIIWPCMSAGTIRRLSKRTGQRNCSEVAF